MAIKLCPVRRAQAMGRAPSRAQNDKMRAIVRTGI